MTKINNKNRRRTHHPAVTVMVIGILIGVLIFISKVLADRASDVIEDDKNNNPSTTKVEKIPTENQTTTSDGDHKTPIQNDGDDPNTKESLTGVITMAEHSSGVLRIRVNIDQYLTSGTCKLTLSQGDNSFNDEAPIISNASTSTCEGFDVALSGLAASGKWQISINLESNGKTGTITGEADL